MKDMPKLISRVRQYAMTARSNAFKAAPEEEDKFDQWNNDIPF
jgi:hypothetical protein